MVGKMTSIPDSPLPDWREQRRRRAWTLHGQGWSQSEIAKELGVSQGSVSRWLRQVRDKGSVDALRRHPAPGKQALLTADQFARIPHMVQQGAEAFGFQGNRWTIRRFAAALQQTFGVAYHPGHVSRLLRKHCPDWRSRSDSQAAV
jgi:transposase